MIQRICHDRQTYTRICMYMYTQIAPDSADFRGKRARDYVTLLPSRQKEKKEEEMICTGRAAYQNDGTVCVNVYIFLNVKQQSVKCRRIKKNL